MIRENQIGMHSNLWQKLGYGDKLGRQLDDGMWGDAWKNNQLSWWHWDARKYEIVPASYNLGANRNACPQPWLIFV